MDAYYPESILVSQKENRPLLIEVPTHIQPVPLYLIRHFWVYIGVPFHQNKRTKDMVVILFDITKAQTRRNRSPTRRL